MPIANPVNPRKKFMWTVEFDNLLPQLVQKVKIPKLTIEEAKHGIANIDIKTGGKVTVGDIEITKMMHQNKNENWAYSWLKKCSNVENGQMGVPSEYKRNGYIIWLAPDGTSTLQKWQAVGCWVKDIEPDELDKMAGADNMMEKVILACDYVVEVST